MFKTSKLVSIKIDQRPSFNEQNFLYGIHQRFF
jgi:hypothetical protein